MAFIDIGLSQPPGPVLERGPVRLRPPGFEDYWAWSRLRERSRAHLTRWEQDWTDAEMTAAAYRLRVKAYWREMRRGGAAPLFVFQKDGDALAGGVTLSNIRYGAACAGTVGYWIGVDFLRRGYGRAAMDALLDHAFLRLGLNRVEAACQPLNEASRRLLVSCGFREEGLACRYLRINGAWRDHLLFAKTASDPR